MNLGEKMQAKTRKECRGIAWSNFILIGIAFMITYIHNNATGTMSESLIRDMGFTNVDLSNFSSIYIFAYTLCQIPVGYIIDRLGAKKVVISGMMLCASGSFFFGFAQSQMMMNVLRFIIGMGAGTCFGCMMKTQSVWFERKQFQMLTGLTSFMGNCGSIFAAAPLALALGFIGWRGTFRGLGVVTFILIVVMLFVLKDSQDYPQEYWQEQQLATQTTSQKSGLLSIFSWQYALLVVIVTLVSSSEISFLVLWIIPYLTTAAAYTTQTAANVATIMTIGVVVSTVTVGGYQRLFPSKKWVMCGTCLLYSVGMSLLLFCTASAPLLSVACFVAGYAGNMLFVLCVNQVRCIIPESSVSLGLNGFNACFHFTIIGVHSVAAMAVDWAGQGQWITNSYAVIPGLFFFFGMMAAGLCWLLKTE